MARLDERLREAQDALATFEALARRRSLTVAERDGAILRLVYTFEAIWKSAALLLEQSEGVVVGSPKAAIRASRQTGLLSDVDAVGALQVAEDRNLTVHMYKQEIGKTIAERLTAHAGVLRRWLDALGERAADRLRQQ